MIARHARHVRGQHQALGFGLVAHGTDGAGRRTDEDQAGFGHGVGELGVLGQESIARMDGVGTSGSRGSDDGRNIEVGLTRCGSTDTHGPIRAGHVWAVAIGLGVDGNGAKPKSAGRPHDADGDLAPVGHEHGMEGSAGS